MKSWPVSKNHWRLVPLLLALGMAALACNLPYLAGQGEQLEAEIATGLQAALERPVKSVRLEGERLVLAYEAPLIQAQETTLAQVALLLESGAVIASRVEQVRVEVESRGAPYLAVTARARDARLLAKGELAIEAFLASLQVEDLRPLEQAIQQELELLGYNVRSVSYQDGVLELSFWQPEIDSVQTLVQSWLPAWRVAAWKAPEASQVVLHVGMFGQPDLRVAAPMQLLHDFNQDQLTPAEFLLGLDLQDE